MNIYQSNTYRKDLSWLHFHDEPRAQEVDTVLSDDDNDGNGDVEQDKINVTESDFVIFSKTDKPDMQNFNCGKCEKLYNWLYYNDGEEGY